MLVNVILTILFGRNPRRTLGCSLIILVGIAVVVGGVVLVGAISLKQDQDAARNRYGENVLNLCDGLKPDTAAQAKLVSSAGAKLAVINSDTKTIRNEYLSSLPANRQAKDKTDVTGVVCVNETSVAFGSPDEYSDSSGKVMYTCQRYQKVVDAYLVDVKSGTLAAYQQFTGAEPPQCPDKISSSTTRTGDSPSGADVAKWAQNPG